MALVECVPNFSEGRDPAVVDAIVAAMLAVPGVFLLDREMDADHHRSVVTLAGEPKAVAEAAVRGVGEAARRIDLRHHQGAHPRVGAADVVPFIPLAETTLAECVALAEWAGSEIWRRFQIPVYFYESAARRPERKNLEVLRKGGFEGLRDEVRTNPDRRPDLGPEGEAALHPSAGATIVGARKFLIAYNINLDTPDKAIASQIARTIRTSSGGLPALKAMGVQLSNPPRAQVSMNLTDFETTSLATAWRAVGAEAAKLGVRTVESELIGLAPRQAVENAAAELLQLTVFDSDRVVENRLAKVMGATKPSLATMLEPFLAALASEEPAPGGGSAAAAVGAMSAALGEMVSRLAEAKLQRTGGETGLIERWKSARQELTGVRQALAQACDQDSAAFLAIRDARRLPKTTESEKTARAAAIVSATILAAEVPLGVCIRARRLRSLLRELQPLTPPAMLSDVTSALALAEAAFSGARDNVVINLASLPPESVQRREIEAQMAKL